METVESWLDYAATAPNLVVGGYFVRFYGFFFLFLTVLLTFQSRPQWKRCYPKINGNSLCPKDWDAGQNLLTQQVSKIASLGNKTSKLTYIQSSLFSFGQCEAKLHRCSDATSFTAGVAHLTCPLPLDYSNDLPRAQNPLQASSRFLSHYKKETKKERNNVKNLLQIYLIIKSKEWGYAGGRCCAVIRTETAQTKMKVCDHSQQAGHVVQVCMYRSFRVSWSSQVQVLQEPSTMAPESQAVYLTFVVLQQGLASSPSQTKGSHKSGSKRSQPDSLQLYISSPGWTPQSDNNYKHWANIDTFHKHHQSAPSH